MTGFVVLIHSCSLYSISSYDIDALVFILGLSLGGLFVLLPLTLTSSRFVAMGSIRHLKALIVSDILLEACFIALFPFLGVLDSSSDHYLSRHLIAIPLFLIFTILFLTLLIASGRAPFDMPEAESELISGCFTDLGGISFSLCLLVDYLEILAWFILMATLCYTLSMTLLALIVLLALAHIGRLILIRIQVSDIPKLGFVVLL